MSYRSVVIALFLCVTVFTLSGCGLLGGNPIQGIGIASADYVQGQSVKPPNLLSILNEGAGAPDSADIQKYSKNLLNLVVPDQAGQEYLFVLSNRLAHAESMAREGKRKLVSEKVIAHAFNDLMRETGAPVSLKADLNSVKSSRMAFEKQMPDLITRERNGSYCLPGESTFILGMLIENVGRPPIPLSESGLRVVGMPIPPVRNHLLQYYANHSQAEIIGLFNHLAKNLNF